MSDSIPGYHMMGRCIARTEKAMLFLWNGTQVWIPRDALKYAGAQRYAPQDTIDSALEYNRLKDSEALAKKIAKEQEND